MATIRDKRLIESKNYNILKNIVLTKSTNPLNTEARNFNTDILYGLLDFGVLHYSPQTKPDDFSLLLF